MIVYAQGFLDPKQEIEFLRQRLAEFETMVKNIQETPALTATVLQVGSKKATLSVNGQMIEIRNPTHVKISPGLRVHCDAKTFGVLDIVEDPFVTGAVRLVVSVIDSRHCEVNLNPMETGVVLFQGERPEIGDRVVLDATSQIVVRNLGQPKPPAGAAVETGVDWDDVGGLEEAKKQFREAIEGPVVDVELHKRYGKKRVRGALLCGPPGCIDGDAEVTVNRAGKSFRLPLRELVRRFVGGTFHVEHQRKDWKHAEGEGHRCASCGQRWPCAKQRRRDAQPGGRRHTWDDSIPTMVRCLWNGEFRLRQLVAAYPKGIRPVVKMTLADGKVLRLTGDHEVGRPGEAWTRADALRPGDAILTNGLLAVEEPTPGVGRYLCKGYWMVCAGLKNHPNARHTPNGGYELAEHRLVAEAAINGFTLEQWLSIVREGRLTAEHVLLPDEIEVHHKDEDPTNNSPDNLVALTKSEHAREHRFRANLPVFQPKETQVVSIEPDGEAEVFDLTVEEAHNFVANGVVVHNCGKTLLGKAAATAIARLHGKQTTASGFQYVKGPELLNPLIGKSEENVRKLFDNARMHFKAHKYPSLVFIDEGDALLVRRGSRQGFEGMERTIVPMFLAEMDGLEESGAFVVVATNRADTLDPAILRDGRLDAKILVRRPTQAEAADILAKHLKGRPLGDQSLEEGAKAGARELFAEALALYMVRTKSGKDRRFTLGQLCSGAMCAGLVERATTLAMRREKRGEAPNGISGRDLSVAAQVLLEEQKLLDHTLDLQDFIRPLGEDVTRVDKVAS